MSRIICPVASGFIAADQSNGSNIGSNHGLELFIGFWFILKLTGETHHGERISHISPVDRTASDICCVFFCESIGIDGGTFVWGQGTVEVCHTAKPTAKCTKFCAIIKSHAPFTRPCPSALP